MRSSFVRALVVLALAGVAVPRPAAADTLYAGLEAGTLRSPSDFSHPVLSSDIATVTHTYDSGLSWTAYLQNSRRAQDGRTNWAFEGMVGYRYNHTPSLSVYGNVGMGEFLSVVRDFPYVTVRGGADFALSRSFTWNVVNLRFRDGLDPDFAYKSSVAGTGFTYRLNETFAVYTRVFAVYGTEFRFDGTGLSIGFRRYF